MKIDRQSSENTIKKGRFSAREVARLCAVVLLGGGAGFCNGLLGAAGGVLLVLILPRLILPSCLSVEVAGVRRVRPFDGSLSRRDLLAISMAVMLPVSVMSGVTYWVSGIRPDPATVALLAIPSAAGGLLGARLLGRMPERHLRLLFSLLLVVSGARMIL